MGRVSTDNGAGGGAGGAEEYAEAEYGVGAGSFLDAMRL